MPELAALVFLALMGGGMARGHRRLGNGNEAGATRELRRVEGKNNGKSRVGDDEGGGVHMMIQPAAIVNLRNIPTQRAQV